MKLNEMNLRRQQLGRGAFSLIEMLVVVAIIGILASIILATLPSIYKNRAVRGAQAQLKMIETEINDYHSKYNSYPLDNPNRSAIINNAVHPLYYELVGSTYNQSAGTFSTVSETITELNIRSYFNQDGFRNVTLDVNNPESAKSKNFFTSLSSDQFRGYDPSGTGAGPELKLLRYSVKDVDANMLKDMNGDLFNPWRYISTGPTNNQASFDLWVEFEVSGSRYRVSNWEKEPVTLSTPAK